MTKYDHLELARIIGEPKDPRKPYPELIEKICEIDTAEPNEYAYYFDVLLETDYIYTTVASGVTQVAVTPDTPALLSFDDIASPEFYVKLTDLANAKERTLARKKATINRALNAEENYKAIQLLATAAAARGNLVDLDSGETTYNYKHVVNQIDQVIDYSDRYVLVAGTYVDKDLKLMDWKDNKYASSIEAFNALGIEVVRVNQTVTRNGTPTSVLASTEAYMVGTATEAGKPILFVRKRMNEIERLGGVISETGDKSDRLVFVSPNPVTVTTTRHLAVGMTGYEQIVLATRNSYAISKFTRSV